MHNYSQEIFNLGDKLAEESMARLSSLLSDLEYLPVAGNVDLKCRLRNDQDFRWYRFSFTNLCDDKGFAICGLGYGEAIDLSRDIFIGSHGNIAVSVGVAVIDGQATFYDFLELANRAVHIEKSQGKNCYAVHRWFKRRGGHPQPIRIGQEQEPLQRFATPYRRYDPNRGNGTYSQLRS